MPTPNAFGARAPLGAGLPDHYRLSSLARAGVPLGTPLDRAPVTLKILLENALRHAGGGIVREEDVATLAAWRPGGSAEAEVPFMPSRVVLQDFTGVPAAVSYTHLSVLSSQGVDVSLVDTHRPHVRDARLAGLDAHYGSVFSEPALREIDLASVGLLVALSGNDEVNTLAVQEFAPVVGRDRVFQLAPVQQDRERHAVRPELLGHVLFDRSATLPALEARHRAGARVKATKLTDQFDFGVYQAGAGEGSMPLFVLHEGGDADAFTAGGDPKPAAGDTVVGLVAPSRGR